MGVERAVTRWYVQRQVLLAEVEVLAAKLASVPSNTSEEVRADTGSMGVVNVDEMTQQLTRAQEKLHLLGPCPKPMMG